MDLSRRSFIKVAGVGTAAGALGIVAPEIAGAQLQSRDQETHNRPNGQQSCDFATGRGGRKPVPLLPTGDNAAAHSRIDTLFWTDIMMEHALFFAMLLPGNELKEFRQRALRFLDRFAGHLERVQGMTITGSNYRELNNRTIDLLLPYIQYKQELEKAQDSAQIHSLVWVTFSAHTRREAERFRDRLLRLNDGNTAFDLTELKNFWTITMEEHARFVAHLLDIFEVTLINQANTAANQFQALRTGAPDPATLLAAANAIITFKEAAETGIENGSINSIIHPALADHVRREAVKFKNEVEVTAGTSPSGGAASSNGATGTSNATGGSGSTGASGTGTSGPTRRTRNIAAGSTGAR
jgi:hypothetical protein